MLLSVSLSLIKSARYYFTLVRYGKKALEPNKVIYLVSVQKLQITPENQAGV